MRHEPEHVRGGTVLPGEGDERVSEVVAPAGPETQEGEVGEEPVPDAVLVAHRPERPAAAPVRRSRYREHEVVRAGLATEGPGPRQPPLGEHRREGRMHGHATLDARLGPARVRRRSPR